MHSNSENNQPLPIRLPPNIIIIDDFYENPDEVRKFALESDYPDPGSTYTYPGRNSSRSYYSDDVHQKFESIFKCKLIAGPNNGYFRLSLEKDSFKQDVHVDPGQLWGSVLFLNTPDQCIDEGGTSFWKHKISNSEFCPLSDAQANLYGFQNANQAWRTTVYGDGLDRDKWIRYLLCPMKYNRLVIFRTDMWHSHTYNFGDCLENGRLVQLSFFNPDIDIAEKTFTQPTRIYY